MPVKLGSKVKDSITGFEGIAIARSEWMYGCTRIVVESQTLKDGKPIDGQWFDEQRIETIQEGVLAVDEEKDCAIQLGQMVKDQLTGFTGMATAKTVWSSGNVTISVEPKELKDGKPISSEAFDVHRLEIVTPEPEIPVSSNADPSKPGGPQNDPKQAM